MGMYTELNCAFELKKDTPQAVIELLRYMTGEAEEAPEQTPEHPLFSTTRWVIMLRCDSYYFDGDSHSTICLDETSRDYYVTIRTNLKNYDSEIEYFIDWVTPYMEKYSGDFVGYKRYEEHEMPTLLFHPNQWREVKLDEPLRDAA